MHNPTVEYAVDYLVQNPSDWQKIKKLEDENWDDLNFIVTQQEKSKTPKERYQNLIEAIKKGTYLSKVAVNKDGDYIGEVIIRIREPEKIRHTGIVGPVLVDPKYRGKGIAHTLMNTAIEEVKKQFKLEILQLSVVSCNTAALKLYQKIGFHIYGTSPRAFKLNNVYYDEIMMYMEV
jgi:RimJ/RimL family protein N-acetyltransferase